MANDTRTKEYASGVYSRSGGCMELPVPDDAPFFVKDYSEYYKGRAYHARSLNSNEGWAAIGQMSMMNQPILQYSNEIRSAVLIMHGEKAHSCYMGKDAYAAMVKDSKYTENKELMIIPDAVHTDLYDSYYDCNQFRNAMRAAERTNIFQTVDDQHSKHGGRQVFPDILDKCRSRPFFRKYKKRQKTGCHCAENAQSYGYNLLSQSHCSFTSIFSNGLRKAARSTIIIIMVGIIKESAPKISRHSAAVPSPT
jgi:hypothetical protein